MRIVSSLNLIAQNGNRHECSPRQPYSTINARASPLLRRRANDGRLRQSATIHRGVERRWPSDVDRAHALCFASALRESERAKSGARSAEGRHSASYAI